MLLLIKCYLDDHSNERYGEGMQYAWERMKRKSEINKPPGTHSIGE